MLEEVTNNSYDVTVRSVNTSADTKIGMIAITGSITGVDKSHVKMETVRD